ncbi:hypothetical protein L1049_003836 [Liquidambar formosana]|uniref:Uncharacterized protein n=1 Tax=Liquidambar formosana TaxID=63359 RepID=A0AAP0WZR8_LIQFO
MDDFPGLLARDFGFRPQGKSAPMAPSKGASNISSTGGTLNVGIGSGGAADHSRSSSSSSFSKGGKSGSFLDDQDRDGLLFSDVFGGPPKYTSSDRSRGGGDDSASSSAFDYDSIFQGSNAKSSSLPVYDKPVYDEDIFNGLPGIKNSSASSSSFSSSSVKYNDVFSSVSNQSPPFDDLLRNLGRTEPKGSKVEKDVPSFDDLIPGFGRSKPPNNNRPNSEPSRSQKKTSDSTKTASKVMEDPFVVLESTSTPMVLSSGLFTDPLEQFSKLSSSGNKKGHSSSVNGGVFDDLDPLGSLGKSVPASEMSYRGKDRSPSKQDKALVGPKIFPVKNRLRNLL